MAHAHGICISTEPGDKVEAYPRSSEHPHRWITIGGAVSVFLPHDDDAAIEFLGKLVDAAVQLSNDIYGTATVWSE
jgi:hypothetical protein